MDQDPRERDLKGVWTNPAPIIPLKMRKMVLVKPKSSTGNEMTGLKSGQDPQLTEFPLVYRDVIESLASARKVGDR